MTSEYINAISGLDLAEIMITSTIEIHEGPIPKDAFTIDDIAGIGVLSQIATGNKCIRCFKVLPEVGQLPVKP